MRVSQELLTSQSLMRLQNRLSSFENIQTQLGTGRKFQVASEDVAGMNVGLALRAEQRSLEQATRNANDGRSRVDVADSKLQQMVTALRRGRDLAIRGANNMQQSERDAIADEIATISDQLVEIANSRFLGQGLFAGFAAGDAVTNVAGTWTYSGDNGQVIRRVGETERVQVNVVGEDVFGFASGTDVFTILDTLEADLRAGNVDNVANAIGDIDTAQDNMADGLAKLGSAGNVIDAALTRNAEQDGIIRSRRAEVEDVDLAEAVMELQTQEVALQATLGALSRSLQPSLIDFLS